MTVISNDPSWWPLIKFNLVFNYFAVASFTAVAYDWLMFGKEFELVWVSRVPCQSNDKITVLCRRDVVPSSCAASVISKPGCADLKYHRCATSGLYMLGMITKLTR
ncbi:hypothetical protein BDR07DRAFT_1427787 [Suillus spraguei]|nr:hypothetical protein BDR07DRAFT_1427787 [Suillus spraguei]